jgi:hypothetical protein
MRNILVCFLLLIFKTAESQDTLIFNNGDTAKIDLISIDESKGLLMYIDKSDTIFVSSGIIKEYRIHSEVEHTLPESIVKSAEESGSKYVVKHGFLTQPGEERIGKFAVSTSLTSLLENSPEKYRLHYALNRVITIEPEYFLSHKLSLKMPIEIGVSRIKLTPDNIDVWSMYSSWSYSEPPTINVSYFNDSYWTYSYLHPQNLIFQLGLYTKHFSSIPRKNYLYFSQGLNFGIDDIYALDMYHHISYNEQNDYWDVLVERIIAKKNQVYFFKYELLGGLNWSLGRIVSLTMETGLAFKLISKGKIEDHVYRSIETSDYELSYTHLYDNKQFNKRIIFHLGLSFRINGN